MDISMIREKTTHIVELRAKLDKSDYKTIKYLEGELSEEEYRASLAERKAWREEINALQVEVRAMAKQYDEEQKALREAQTPQA